MATHRGDKTSRYDGGLLRLHFMKWLPFDKVNFSVFAKGLEAESVNIAFYFVVKFLWSKNGERHLLKSNLPVHPFSRDFHGCHISFSCVGSALRVIVRLTIRVLIMWSRFVMNEKGCLCRWGNLKK